MKVVTLCFVIFFTISSFLSCLVKCERFNSFFDENDDQEFNVGRRGRRQISSQCPNEAANSGDNGRSSFILFYSPRQRKDIKINYDKEGWSDSKLKTLINNGFNVSQPTLLYAHAYFQSARSGWLLNVRNRYDGMFKRNDPRNPTSINLMFFDWSSYSQQPYASSVSMVPHLGKVLGEFLEKLSSEESYNLKQMHIISYSLSTHISGLASKQAGQVGQITALDPTGVCFIPNSSFANRYALKASDAKLVVARHYDMGVLGAKQPIGGLDIFVNGGKNQPIGVRAARTRGDDDSTSSSNEDGLLVLQQGRIGSSHSRAADHETQVPDDECQEVAYECRSYAAFLAGECADCGSSGEHCFLLNSMSSISQAGLQTRSSSSKPSVYQLGTKMFIKTGPGPTYCLQHYQILAHFKPATASITKQLFDPKSKVVFDFGPHLQVKLKNQLSENTFSALATLNKRIPNVNPVSVLIDGHRNTMDEESRRILSAIDHIDIKYMSSPQSNVREKLSFKMCPKSSQIVKC